jgi:hypothetical protein
MIGVAAAVVVAAGIGAAVFLRPKPAPQPADPAAIAASGPIVQDVVVPSAAPKAPSVRVEDAEAVATEPVEPAAGRAGDVRPVTTPAPGTSARPEPATAAGTQPVATLPSAPRPTLAPGPAAPPPTAPPATAAAAPAVPVAAPAGPTRTFQPGRSRIDSLRAAKGGGPKGFDLGDAAVKSSAEFEGSVQFEFSPPAPRAGEPFSVKIFLENAGTKDADIKVFTLSPIVNGTRQTLNPAPKVGKVKKGTRALVYEYTGTWKDEKSWELEAIVTTTKQDVCRNRLTWK